VAHADNLSVFNMAAFRAAHAMRPSTAVLTMMTFTTDSPSSCGIVTTEQGGLVNGFFEKVPNPPGDRANAAVYIFEQEVLDYAVGLRKTKLDLSTEVLPNFIGRMWTWHNAEYHQDVGTMKAWREAQRDYPLREPRAPEPDPWANVLHSMVPRAEATIAALLKSA
jgi:mannose-1-phosphate guanylyltransferase